MRASAVVLALAVAAGAAHAQLVPQDPDWKEADAPPPPEVRTQGLIPLDMGRGTDLAWGVDPQSVSILRDRIVRYVVVAQAQDGTLNASYEGIKCGTGEVRVYARHARDGRWVPASPDWKPLAGNGAHRHSLAIARAGACVGQGANISAAQVVHDLRGSVDERGRPELRR